MWACLLELNSHGTYGITLERESLVEAGILDEDGDRRVEDLRLQQYYDPEEREFRIRVPSEDRLEKLAKRERQASLADAD